MEKKEHLTDKIIRILDTKQHINLLEDVKIPMDDVTKECWNTETKSECFKIVKGKIKGEEERAFAVGWWLGLQVGIQGTQEGTMKLLSRMAASGMLRPQKGAIESAVKEEKEEAKNKLTYIG